MEVKQFNHIFVTAWIHHKVEFQEEVTLGGLPAKEAWQVGLLCDCKMIKSISRAHSFARDSTEPAIIIWGMLQGIIVMREYIEANFRDHSDKAGILMRYVIKHQGELDKGGGGNAP